MKDASGWCDLCGQRLGESWTKTEEEMIVTGIADGLSFSQLSDRLRDKSRSAVAGKVWRMRRAGELEAA